MAILIYGALGSPGSHVKPQSEHLAPASGLCALKLDFIGKSEHLADDWAAFLQDCQGSQPKPAEQWDNEESRAMKEFMSLAQAERPVVEQTFLDAMSQA